MSIVITDICSLFFLLDSVAVCLLFLSSLRFGLSCCAAFCVLVSYSGFYVPFELWNMGSHYDQHTLFFTSFFIYGIARFYKSVQLSSALLLGVSAALLISQSTVCVPGVFIAVIIVCCANFRQDFKKMLSFLCLCCLFPLLITAILIGKNYAHCRVFATSNGAGWAASGVLYQVLGVKYGADAPLNFTRVREFLANHKAPEWYLWCYDHPEMPTNPKTGHPYSGWMFLAKAGGICSPFMNNADECNVGNYWPNDFRPLEAQLKTMGEYSLAKIVHFDVEASKDKHYLFSGFAPEGSSRWMGVYGNISTHMYRAVIVEHPILFLKVVSRFNKAFRAGQEFPLTIMKSDRLLSQAPFLEACFTFLITPVSVVLGFGYSLLFLGWFFIGFFLKLLQNVRQAMKSQSQKQHELFGQRFETVLHYAIIFVLMSIPALVLTGVYSSLASGEHDRYYMQITPYLVMLFILFCTCCSSLTRFLYELLVKENV